MNHEELLERLGADFTNKKLRDALWAGDVDALDELAPCSCCCYEHTHAYCPARLWGGCRGGLALGESEQSIAKSWQEHYAKFHGMSEEEFYR